MKRTKTKKPAIPDSPESWRKEMDGINNFLKQMRAQKLGEFDYWRKGMIRYYTERKKFLLHHKPRGVK